MKAISLTQPWATLVAIGAKQYETRSFRTNHRGPLAIQASKSFPRECILLCFEKPFSTVLYAAGIRTPDELPRGMVIATVNLTACEQTEVVRNRISAQEEEFGDYDDGRYAWTFENPVRLAQPVAARGSLGLWEWAMPAELPTVVSAHD